MIPKHWIAETYLRLIEACRCVLCFHANARHNSVQRVSTTTEMGRCRRRTRRGHNPRRVSLCSRSVAGRCELEATQASKEPLPRADCCRPLRGIAKNRKETPLSPLPIQPGQRPQKNGPECQNPASCSPDRPGGPMTDDPTHGHSPPPLPARVQKTRPAAASCCGESQGIARIPRECRARPNQPNPYRP